MLILRSGENSMHWVWTKRLHILARAYELTSLRACDFELTRSGASTVCRECFGCHVTLVSSYQQLITSYPAVHILKCNRIYTTEMLRMICTLIMKLIYDPPSLTL
jgi:hypothetical protein